MRHVAQWSALSLLCLLGTQHGQAEPAACVGERACRAEESAGSLKPVSAVAKIASLAGPERCPGAAIDVNAASADQRHLACSAASHALELLGQCGISLRRPLRVQIMSEVRHPFSRDQIFGLFDTKHERVLVTEEANLASLVKGTPYAELPPRDFYRSLIVHEVVHGVMHQNLKRRVTSHAAYEYPAYALQIESLAADVRNRFLQSFDQTAITSRSLFNDTVLFFDPYFFAASAHQHFRSSPDGCAHIRALLEGDVPFIAPPM